MSAVLAIAVKDLRQRLRDRSAIVLGFVAPLAVAWLISMAFGSTGVFSRQRGSGRPRPGPGGRRIHDVRQESGPRQAAHGEVGGHRSERQGDGQQGRPRRSVRHTQGFSAAITSGSSRPITILTSVDSSIAGQVAQSLAESYTAQAEAVQLSVKTAVASGASAASVEQLAAEAATVRIPEQTVTQASGATMTRSRTEEVIPTDRAKTGR
jgi:ABC-2 type transport system permease protein